MSLVTSTGLPATRADIDLLDRTKVLHNGEKVRLTFSDAEMKRRLEGLRAAMEAQGIDSVILNSYHNIKYYSDFLFTSFGRRYGLVVTADSLVSITANIDGGMPWRRSYGENLVYTDWQRDNFWHAVAKVIADDGVDAHRIGIEADWIPVVDKEQYQATFPAAELVDVSGTAMSQRMIKSEEEIAVIRESARIADIGGYAIHDAIAEGVREYELSLIGTEAMTQEIARSFPDSEIRDTWVWFQSGVNTDGAHNWATTRRLRRGDVLSMNCFAMPSGYYTALERTMFMGDPGKRASELWEINLAVHEAGLSLIKPGARCGDIAHALNEIYVKHGLFANRSFGYGHSFGVIGHYYGREGRLELREDVETVLEPGMVVSMEPMIMVQEDAPGAGGYREHDILVVGQDGAENITAYPYGPDFNIIEP
ncbi:M24 family metallopeptidase [Kocuria coralli]|uniref:M24 family metallopeptidase n=1 Tax=Kocuria coralli TaxID=1461025 RepID=A0A5J5L0H8_9MICC|nr:aminopeptidase P family protein [Kocuria coralli]KAA9394695.1 M24 family metallopeptidase [Kocuria coralli]